MAVAALGDASARGDEIRLTDGEILFGAVTEQGDRLEVATAAGTRRLRAADVAGRIPGDTPAEALARKEAGLEAFHAGDADRRFDLAAFAWRHRLDDAARRLADEVLALDADHGGAHSLLGRRRTAEGWRSGLEAPWPHAWRTGPRWGSARRKAMSGAWSGRQTVEGLRRALDWLAAHQDEDGRIDADDFSKHDPEDDRCDGAGGGHHGERVPCGYDGATTAVAVMAWLASGSTPVSGPYADNVKRGLDFCVGVLEGGGGGFDSIWNLALATQAVADAFAVTRDVHLRWRVVKAMRALLGVQRPDGGWSYAFSVGDVPTTAVVAVALGQCAQAGIGVPADAATRCVAFLDERVDAKTGRSEYHDGAERKGYTPTTANAAAALTARLYLGAFEDTPALGKQIAAISKKKPKWKIEFKDVETRDGRTVRAQIGNLYPYAWYYQSLALHARGGSAWSSWGGALRKTLLDGQRKEGSAAGSWDPLGQYSTSGGRAFVTALCALMLQVQCRNPV